LFDPDYYFDRKPLPQVSLPRPPALDNVSGLRRLGENTMGELGYYGLIAQLTSEDEAKPVAMEWLADHYLIYEYSGKMQGEAKYAVVARTKWSTTEKAQAFFELYKKIIEKKYPGLSPDARSGPDLFIVSAGSSGVIMARKDDEVRWAEGIPARQSEAMLDWLGSLKN
jgi:hypothetical protein